MKTSPTVALLFVAAAVVAAVVMGVVIDRDQTELVLSGTAPVAETVFPSISRSLTQSVLPERMPSNSVSADLSTFRFEQMCGNSFLAGENASAKPLDQMIHSLPSNDVQSQREAALRELNARCEGAFQANDRELKASHLVNALRQAAKEITTPPALAIKLALDSGNVDTARIKLEEAIRRHDPVDWIELSNDAPIFPFEIDPEKSRKRFAALGLVACDRSIDCGSSSFMALQLCAFQGSCMGTVTDRIAPLLGYSIESLAADATEIRTRLAGPPAELIGFLLGDRD